MRSIRSPSIVTKRESTRYHEASSIVFHSVCAVHATFHKFQSTAHQPKYARVSSCSHVDVVMLFCFSFTQCKRFLQTYQLIITFRSCSHDKLHSHIDKKRVRERFQVMCSDLVGSDLPHPLIDVRQIAATVKVGELWDEPFEQL